MVVIYGQQSGRAAGRKSPTSASFVRNKDRLKYILSEILMADIIYQT